MREQWARNIALLTGLLVVLLAILFAKIQNPSEPLPSTVGDTIDKRTAAEALPERDKGKQHLIAAGRKVFEAQRCEYCHSIAGKGNPRNPLDGMGERRTAENIRQWILAPIAIKDQLPAGAFQAKQAYRDLPLEDIDALVAYLQSLRPTATN